MNDDFLVNIEDNTNNKIDIIYTELLNIKKSIEQEHDKNNILLNKQIELIEQQKIINTELIIKLKKFNETEEFIIDVLKNHKKSADDIIQILQKMQKT